MGSGGPGVRQGLFGGLEVPTGAPQEWRPRVGQAVVQARLSYISRTAEDALWVLFSLTLA